MKQMYRNRIKARVEGITFYLLIALLVAMVGWLSQRYSMTWDWSDTGRNSLTPASQLLLTRLEAPLKITSFAPENPELRRRIREIVERYQRFQPTIQLDFINPSLFNS